jgi:hypothetical protein
VTYLTGEGLSPKLKPYGAGAANGTETWVTCLTEVEMLSFAGTSFTEESDDDLTSVTFKLITFACSFTDTMSTLLEADFPLLLFLLFLGDLVSPLP